MAILTKFESVKQLTFADLQALASKTRAELDDDGRTCDVADLCRAESGLTKKCGFVNVGTVRGCPKRKRLLQGQSPTNGG